MAAAEQAAALNAAAEAQARASAEQADAEQVAEEARARAAAEQVASQEAAAEAHAKAAAEAEARAAAEAQARAAAEEQARDAATRAAAGKAAAEEKYLMLKEQARKYEEELRQMGAATVSNPPGHTVIPQPVKVMSKMNRELNVADLMMLKEQARKYEEELRQMGAATVSRPPGHTAIPQPVKVTSKMILNRELYAAEQTATRSAYAAAAGVPVESVEISKDGQSKGSYSITVYVKDAATAAAAATKLSDAALLESALTSVGVPVKSSPVPPSRAPGAPPTPQYQAAPQYSQPHSAATSPLSRETLELLGTRPLSPLQYATNTEGLPPQQPLIMGTNGRDAAIPLMTEGWKSPSYGVPPQQPLIQPLMQQAPSSPHRKSSEPHNVSGAVSAGRCGVRSNMTLDRELNAAEQTATRCGYAEAAGVPVESVQISKDGQSKGSYSITVYVKDAATAAAVSNKLSDPALLESALTSVGVPVKSSPVRPSRAPTNQKSSEPHKVSSPARDGFSTERRILFSAEDEIPPPLQHATSSTISLDGLVLRQAGTRVNSSQFHAHSAHVYGSHY